MVSVVVLSWNAQDEVLACVQSLLLAAQQWPLEIIVIDNASQDGSAQALRTISGIQLVTNQTNLGYAGGNNQGFQLATGDQVLLLNQDTVVNADAIQAMSRWLTHHPDYAAATVRLANPDGSTQYYMHRRFPHWYDLPLALIHKRLAKFLPAATKRYLYLDQDFLSDFDLEQAAGACIMVRRSAIQRLGKLFDQQHFPLYYNDVDLCRRLHQAGWNIRCLTNVSIMHLKGTSIRKVPTFKNILIYSRALWNYFVGTK